MLSRESEVVAAWQRLLGACDGRRARLADTGDLFRFLCMVRDLLLWMEDVVRQMNTSEKPRDVSGVELLMNNHQSLKAEVDAREDNLSSCVALGKELLARGHYASGEIKEKLLALTTQRGAMMARWDERWEHLQLILEVYQFARDAAVAEHWLVAQEPYLLSQELGHAIDEVEQLIKKHEAFEKSAAAQEERFAALERLTTFELKEMRAREEEQERQRQQEEMERLAALQPPPSHEPSQDRVDAEASAEAVREQPVLNGEQERHVGEQHAEAPTPPKDKKKRSRSKSPFGSWRRKKSPLDDSDEAAFSEKLSAPTDEDGQFEGLLLRKHEWESTTKKASNRSWEKVYVVIRGAVLAAYKDQKHYKQEPESHYRNEPPIDLRTATAEVAADYTKKKHVFRLKLSNGGEFLFQGRDDDEMGQWLQKVQAAIGEADGSAGPSRAQTLPAERKDEPKKRSFFTLKKK
ncbi:hypothetical protein HPB47_020250 [Ixodes persulcatus]|uniref:Uncharacterized protein n=1 Tax=Ixodes persulcatus TaxID=34615 RepID=A0AC60QGY8_IXOPE|nr:hypothetical protein HPB47_020250 [Ixodes persulcatus]